MTKRSHDGRPSAVELRGLAKAFHGPAGTVQAVGGLDISIRSGEIVALLGANGAGKSTTIDMLLGLTDPDVGTVHILDPALAAAAIAAGESPLTPREQDVLRAAQSHETAADIAAALYLSEGTVRNYLSAAIQKLGARNRSDAIDMAVDQGWI